MRSEQDSEWEKKVNMILWVEHLGPIKCTIAVFTAECIIDTDILHACTLNAYKVQRRVP